MQEVWFFFKLLETVLGLVAMGFQMKGFLNVPGAQDNHFDCAVFFLFTLIAMFGNLNICIGLPAQPISEAIICVIGALMYLAVSLLSMYHAEKDFYLVYLSDFEEPLHPFFRYSKSQSIAALVCSVTYILHAVLAIQISLAADSEVGSVSNNEDESISSNVVQPPLRLYLFGKTVQDQLEKYNWFVSLTTTAGTESLEMV